MITFCQFIEGAAVAAPGYVNPDDLYYRGNPEVTFIFTPGRQLIATDGHTPHNELVFQEPEYRPAVMGPGARLGDFQRQKMLQRNLLGRVGTLEGEHLVSFWNSPLEVFNALARECLKSLWEKSLITPQTRISAPTVHDRTVGDFLGGASQVTQPNPQVQRAADLARQVHLMRGDQKKAAMKALGVGMTPRRHPWVSQMQQQGFLAPGWRLGVTSEETR